MSKLYATDTLKWYELTSLYCVNASITASTLPETGLIYFDTQGLSAVKILDCSFNLLSTLELQNLSAITILDCSYNNITSLNVSTPIVYLREMYCNNNKITNFSSQNFSTVTAINLSYNLISSFSPTDNVNVLLLGNNKLNTAFDNNIGFGYSINLLDLNSNNISSIDVSNFLSLYSIDLNSNNLSSIEGADFANTLVNLEINRNKLKSLNTSTLPNLEYLDCSFNSITSINLLNNKKLTFLDCNTNRISTIDTLYNSVSTLYCGLNPLCHLSLQNLTSLRILDFSYSNLSSVSIDGLSALSYLNCSGNRLSASTLNTILTTICSFNFKYSLSGNLYAYDNAEKRTSSSDSAFYALTSLGWTLLFD